jgi:hypothetical protein
MRRSLALSGLILSLSLVCAPAFASGGGGTGGGGTGTAGGGTGGGGGTLTDPATAPTGGGGSPCVTINSFAVTADQSVATADASLAATYAVSRCGGNNASFDIRLQATDTAGVVGWTAGDSWFPTRNLPYNGARQTDAAGFGATYTVTLSVLVPGTGTVVATASRTAATPAQRLAGCATITNMNASGGYSPGSTTVGAIWSGYTVQNCGGADWFDMSMTETNQATGIVDWSYNTSSTVASRNTTGVGLVDNDYAPTATTYTVTVKVRRHSTGEELASRSLVASTPAAR